MLAQKGRKRMGYWIIVIVVLIAGWFLLARPDLPRYQNQEYLTESNGLFDVIRWKMNANPVPWPAWIDEQPKPMPSLTERPEELKVTFVNHSTLMIQYHGLVLLTDPIWSEFASPVQFAGPKRVRPPGIKLEDIPKVDVLMVSHNHYDHMDETTLRQIAARFQPVVFTGMGIANQLRSFGFEQVTEMNWWDKQAVNGMMGSPNLLIHYVPAHHNAGRGLFDRNRTLWGGFVLESEYGNVYFAGDTAKGVHDQQLKERFGAFRLAALPIGAYEPRWFMKRAHINPPEAVDTFETIAAKQAIGIHFGTFAGLTDEGIDQPMIDLQAELERRGIPNEQFRALGFGETLEVN